MKYDLMLIGPATRDVNIDYTGKEVHEIGGAVFFCSAAAKAAGANLFASVKIHPDDTDIIDAFKLDSDHVAILPSETTTLMQNTYFTADRERRKAECLAQSGPITPDQIPEVDGGLYHLAGLLYGDFPNELITAIQEGNVQAFRNKYRMVDLLLLDDVQFIAGKERTQEEFFHTFNALYEAKKQIVLTSDRPPKEINTLEERMKTRFEWGLLADIQPPDFETRIAIIRDKAVKMSIELPDEVSNYIAENIQSNIRQLEGAVKKIKAMHELMGERITVSLAENAIDALRTENPGLNPTPERIMEAVANYFYIPVEQMISKDRSKDVAYPRQMAMYMIRQELEYSFPDIAKIFKRDHTTVMHACNKIEEERKKSRQTEDVIKKLHNNIRGD